METSPLNDVTRIFNEAVRRNADSNKHLLRYGVRPIACNAFKYNLDKLIEQINDLNGSEIDAKTLGGKFAIDAFLQSALSVDMNKDLGNIKD